MTLAPLPLQQALDSAPAPYNSLNRSVSSYSPLNENTPQGLAAWTSPPLAESTRAPAEVTNCSNTCRRGQCGGGLQDT